MNIANRLQYLKGKTWLYNTLEHNVIDSMIVEDTIIISTDRGMLKIPVDDAQKKLTEFFEVHKEPKKNGSSNTLPELYRKKEMNSLLDTLTENIEKLKADKEYVDQAKTICMNVTAITNLLKLELEIKKQNIKQNDD